MTRTLARDEEIVRRVAAGETMQKVGDAAGVTKARVSQICKGQRNGRRSYSIAGTGIKDYTVRAMHQRFTGRPVEVWIVPFGDDLVLRMLCQPATWIQGVRLVGRYTSAVVLADFADDVRMTVAEMLRERAQECT